MNRQLHLVQCAFVAIEHDEFGRVKSGELSAEFATDTSARTCHQHTTVDDVVRNLLQIGVDLAATKQVFVGEVANIARVQRAFIQVLYWWNNLDVHSQFLSTTTDVVNQRRVCRRDSNEQCCRTGFSSSLSQAFTTANNRNTRNTEAVRGWIVVQKTNRQIRR